MYLNINFKGNDINYGDTYGDGNGNGYGYGYGYGNEDGYYYGDGVGIGHGDGNGNTIDNVNEEVCLLCI